MFEISSYSVEWIKDPFGIIAGKRYELLLDIEVDEDDEMYSEQGVSLRVIFKVEDEAQSLVRYEFLERGTGKYLDFEMEPEELIQIDAFCREHYAEGEEPN
ncbi:MAG: pullulanase [Paenibacillaceae bacterium]|jgi:hypothetical protein|nr:pullulanase [Paenibacillaceae bacterium]